MIEEGGGAAELFTPVDLSPALRAIAVASQHALNGERLGIMARFALMMEGAKGTVSPEQLAGVLRTLKDQRRAALAIAARNASLQSHAEREQVIQGKPAPPPRSTRRAGGPNNIHG